MLSTHIFECVLHTSTHIGNTDAYLTDTGSVYITHDGGLTWEQVDIHTYTC